MANTNSNLNTILQKVGDFLGRKFKLFGDWVLGKIETAKTEAVKESNTYTDKKVSELVNGAPETLDTLKEIADALGDKDTAIGTVNEALRKHRHDNATHEADGFMSKEDKAYVDGIGTYEQFVAAFNDVVGKDSIFYEK